MRSIEETLTASPETGSPAWGGFQKAQVSCVLRSYAARGRRVLLTSRCSTGSMRHLRHFRMTVLNEARPAHSAIVAMRYRARCTPDSEE
jgi:hypothetical protein